MITLIGVGHVFDIGARLKAAIAARSPELVCLELDRARFQSLLERPKNGMEGAPMMYQMLAGFQQRIADQYGTAVGNEMLAAAEAARDLKAHLAFIDLESSRIFQEFWSEMTLREKVKLMLASFLGMFTSKKGVEKEVARFEENPQDYIEAFSKEFPSAKRVLIDKRDEHMSRKLRELSGRFGRIVAVVGDGHIEGMSRRMADLKPEIVRLSELRKAPELSLRQDGSEYTYSFG
jgi:pheromone shutdown protein TraB